jgi:hypothetical protein
MDTSSYVGDVNRQFRTANMISGQNPNTGVGNAVRGNLLSQYMQGRGQINTQANNYRSQMENQEAQMNNVVNGQNSRMLNDLYSAQNQFGNNKRMAKANNLTNLLTGTQLMAKDYRQQSFDKNIRMPMIGAGYHQQTNSFMNTFNPLAPK